MPQLPLAGQVLYSDMRTPAANVRIQIYDLDQDGNTHDKIFDETTNSNGRFSGLSGEWVDQNTIRITTPFGSLVQEVPDLLALEFRVIANEKVHKGPYFHIDDYASVPIVLPPDFGEVSKSQREVIHLITLSEKMEGLNKLLYETIELGGSLISNSLLTNHYGKVHLLEKEQATLTNLCSQLEKVASKSSVKAVDLVISPHGLNNRLYFYPDEGVAMTTVAEKIKSIPVEYRRKFRTLFSTACFGASHIDEWLDSGFKAASGSEKIYADSLLSFPTFLNNWLMGKTFRDAISAANTADPLRLQDSLAKTKFEIEGSGYANQINSYRRIGGNGSLTISSNPSS